jgi:hypothetical protein
LWKRRDSLVAVHSNEVKVVEEDLLNLLLRLTLDRKLKVEIMVSDLDVLVAKLLEPTPKGALAQKLHFWTSAKFVLHLHGRHQFVVGQHSPI